MAVVVEWIGVDGVFFAGANGVDLVHKCCKILDKSRESVVGSVDCGNW